MKVMIFTFLYILIFFSAQTAKAQESSWVALADSIGREQHREFVSEETKNPTYKAPIVKEALHFQFDTNTTGQPTVLIHLKDSVSSLTISAHDTMGKSLEVIREYKLNQGFYEFVLPKSPSESLKYWQVNMNGQRVISFIR